MMISLSVVTFILIVVIISVTVIIMKRRNSKDIKLKSEKQLNGNFYDDIRNECVNEDYAEPNYDQNYEDGDRYEYNFSVAPKLSKREEEINENVGANQPYYIVLSDKEDMKNMTQNAPFN